MAIATLPHHALHDIDRRNEKVGDNGADHKHQDRL